MKLIKWFFVGVFALGLVGCAASVPVNTTYGTDFNAQQRFQLKKNVTTKQQVQKLFGEPLTKVFDKQERECWIYSYGTRASEVNYYQDRVSSHTKIKRLVIIFNDNGTVRKYLYSTPNVKSSVKAGR